MNAALAGHLGELVGEEAIALPVRGRSMEPALHEGDVVRVRRASRFRVGDVVAFPDGGGRLVLHRVLGSYRRSGRRWLLTQGDGASRPDARVAPESVVLVAMLPVSARDRLHARLRFLRHAARSLLRR